MLTQRQARRGLLNRRHESILADRFAIQTSYSNVVRIFVQNILIRTHTGEFSKKINTAKRRNQGKISEVLERSFIEVERDR